MIRVLIADDHGVVREGIKRIIADAGEMVVAGEAADGEEMLARIADPGCDVVVMDLAMPGRPGLRVLEHLQETHCRVPVIVLSMYPADQYAARAFMAGASGYINKGRPPSELIDAIRSVVAGRRYVSEEVAQSLATHLDTGRNRAPHETLSNREFEVLRLIASGKSVGDIAGELSISLKTVSTYRARALSKLGLRHNGELTRYALANGLVD